MEPSATKYWKQFMTWASCTDRASLRTCFLEYCVGSLNATSAVVYQPDLTGRVLGPHCCTPDILLHGLPSFSLENHSAVPDVIRSLNKPSAECTETSNPTPAASIKFFRNLLFGGLAGVLYACRVKSEISSRHSYFFFLLPEEAGQQAGLESRRPLLELVNRTYEALMSNLVNPDTRESLLSGQPETNITADKVRREQRESEKALEKILVGTSPGIWKVRQKIARYAMSDFFVLIHGETGTGKTLIAKALHRFSARLHGPLVFRSAALLETGYFLDNQNLPLKGTLVLNDIGEMPARTQAALLHVLQNRTLNTVDNEGPSGNFRLICTTTMGIQELLQTGKLKNDLLHRIGQLSVLIPPLRERPEDIEPIASRFLEDSAVRTNSEVRILSTQALEVLRGQSLQGNVRELENVLTQILLAPDGNPVIDADTINRVTGNYESPLNPEYDPDTEESAPGRTNDFNGAMKIYEKRILLNAYKSFSGNRSRMAKELNLPVRTLSYKLRQQGIEGKEICP